MEQKKVVVRRPINLADPSLKRQISVSLGVTLQTRPFESIKLDVGYSTELSPGVDIKEAYGQAWKIVEGELSGATQEAKPLTDSLRESLGGKEK